MAARAQPTGAKTRPNEEEDANVPGITIYNSGTITAPNTNGAGSIHLAAGDMYGLAILNEGTVQAAGGDISMTAQGGAIHNAESGVINVSSNNSADGGIDSLNVV